MGPDVDPDKYEIEKFILVACEPLGSYKCPDVCKQIDVEHEVEAIHCVFTKLVKGSKTGKMGKKGHTRSEEPVSTCNENCCFLESIWTGMV